MYFLLFLLLFFCFVLYLIFFACFEAGIYQLLNTHMSFIFGLRIMMSSKFACLLDGVKRRFQQ
jgi:hypothetical protein